MSPATVADPSTRLLTLDYNQSVAERPSRPRFFDAFDEFERTFDSLFDDLLISRWRTPRRVAADPGTRVADLEDRYEIRMTQAGADARELDIEAYERRLVVRSRGAMGKIERIVDLRHPVEAEAATAELSGGELKVVLPKKRARKINVE
jgi:HSP20 family molecular chaperone IbpA